MRNLFLALVLANLAFAAYHNWFADSGRQNRVAASEPAGLVLASEFEVTDVTPSTASVPPTPSPADAIADVAVDETPLSEAPFEDTSLSASLPDPTPASSCVSVGPFVELSQATTAAANLRASGFEPSQRAGEGDIWSGYWVYLEQLAGVDAAEEIRANLREHGVTDSYVLPRSDSGTLLSLGVFTEIARARNRRDAVRSLGYEPTISDRTRRGTVYWIDVMLDAGELIDFEQLQSPGRIIRLEQRPCEDAPV